MTPWSRAPTSGEIFCASTMRNASTSIDRASSTLPSSTGWQVQCLAAGIWFGPLKRNDAAGSSPGAVGSLDSTILRRFEYFQSSVSIRYISSELVPLSVSSTNMERWSVGWGRRWIRRSFSR